MSAYIGTIPTPQATQTRQTFVATASQTTFTTIGFVDKYLDVFLNGVKLVYSTDFTTSGGNQIVLNSGAAADDVLDVVLYTANTDTVSNGGRYKGERGTVGASAAAGDIFRVHEQTLNTNVTIDSTESALCAGPLTVASGVVLTIATGGNLAIL
jgi:hypothetical protein